MDDDVVTLDFEVDAVLACAEAVEKGAVALYFTKVGAVDVLKGFFGDFEGIEEVELFEGAEFGDFVGTDFIEDDLEHERVISLFCGFFQLKRKPAG